MGRMQLALEGFEHPPLVQLTTSHRVSRKEFRDFVGANPDFRIELTSEGELIVMAPAHSRSGARNAALSIELGLWAKLDGRGIAFDSSAGFDLPNGSNRSPDASWVLKHRLDLLTPDQKNDYLPLCPDFVAEIRSKTDRVSALKAKMHEYMENGAQLGWLIDPIDQMVFVYRSGQIVERLDGPGILSGEPLLSGFVLDLCPIWDPGF